MHTFRIDCKAFFGNGETSIRVKAGSAELAEASVTMRVESAGFYIVRVVRL